MSIGARGCVLTTVIVVLGFVAGIPAAARAQYEFGAQGELVGEDCSAESAARSLGETGATEIVFRNHTPEPRRLYRLDASGVRQQAGLLTIGGSLRVQTWRGHVWLVTKEDGACVTLYRVPQEGVPFASAFATIAEGFPYKQYFAEGAANGFFTTRLALANPTQTTARAVLRFQTSEGRNYSLFRSVAGQTRQTVIVNQLKALENASFSTVVESDVPLVADRTMSWDATGYGAHADAATPAPSTMWYLAEGATTGQFSLFYLLQNPNGAEATAVIRYLRSGGASPIERTRLLPPRSRTTIPVDAVAPELADTDVSAAISSTLPIIVERAMYRDVPGQPFGAGHESAGVTAPALSWFLAEGATGNFFDLFILVANPNAAAAAVTVDYLLDDGRSYAKAYTVAGNSRMTIWVDDESIPGAAGKPLANVSVSSTITSTNGVPVVVERAMWWPGPGVTSNFWTEAHNSPGATQTGIVWSLAEGGVGGPSAAQTYVLIANTSAFAGQVKMTVLSSRGVASRTVDLLPRSRRSVDIGAEFGLTSPFVELTFATLVESLGETPAQIVVERAMYTSPGGVFWAAGTNALATRTDPRIVGAAAPDQCSDYATSCGIFLRSMCGANYDAPVRTCQYVPENRRRECVVVDRCPSAPPPPPPRPANLCEVDEDCPRWSLNMCGNNYGAPIYACQYVPSNDRKECVQVGRCPAAVHWTPIPSLLVRP